MHMPSRVTKVKNMTKSLVGSTFKATYDANLHTLVSIVNTLSGDEYIQVQPKVPLVSLVAIPVSGHKKIHLFPSMSIPSGDETRMDVLLFGFGSYDVEAKLSLMVRGDSLLISMELENRDESVDIVEVLCPHLQGIVLGHTHVDDIIIYPHHAGEKTVNPVYAYGKGRKPFWRAASTLQGEVYRREINYCGLASMSWMYYYDTHNGLYIGSHDPSFPVTGVIAETGSGEEHFMGFAFRKHHCIKKGQCYTSGLYQIAISDKDWHYGAEIYRSYMQPLLGECCHPEFLKHEYAINQCYNFKRNGVVEHRFKDIPDMYQKGKEWGVRNMFIASWNRNGFDSHYPEYYPDMELGTPMELCDGIRIVREQGGFTTLYINARIFDVKSDFYQCLGKRMAIKDCEGSMLQESYGPEDFTLNCPSDSLWQKYLVDFVEFAFKAYGVDGVYLDQLASAEPFPCYDPGHSHEDIGDFNNGYIYILEEIKRRMKAYGKDHYLMTENCGDLYSVHVWSNLTWNGAEYDEFYNVFSYTFPQFKQVNMVNPRGWVKDEAQRMLWFHRDFQRAILLGNILWMGIPHRFGGLYESYARLALSFRGMLQPLLEKAAFLDRKYISFVSSKCDATSWQLDDGTLMVLCGNSDMSRDFSLSLSLERPYRRLESISLSGKRTIMEINDQSISLAPGEERLYCLLFSK